MSEPTIAKKKALYIVISSLIGLYMFFFGLINEPTWVIYAVFIGVAGFGLYRVYDMIVEKMY